MRQKDFDGMNGMNRIFGKRLWGRGLRGREGSRTEAQRHGAGGGRNTGYGIGIKNRHPLSGASYPLGFHLFFLHSQSGKAICGAFPVFIRGPARISVVLFRDRWTRIL